MKTKKIISDVAVHSLSHDGRGIATINGKTIFIHNALPSEKVTCQIIKTHKRYDEGKVIVHQQKAPERTPAFCEHYGVCGGCSLQHVTSEDQIKFKQKILLEQLQHFGKVIPDEILLPITGKSWHYRRKARLSAKYVIKKGKLFLGFREKGSSFLTDLNHCPVITKPVSEALTKINEMLQSTTQYQHIPQVEIAGGDNFTALIIRHLFPFTKEDEAKCAALGEKFNFHIYLQGDLPTNLKCIWPHSPKILFYALPHYDLKLFFKPLHFVQVNAEINEKLIAQALYLLSLNKNDSVLDLFCGLGNFTLPISRYVKRVTGVEGANEMVLQARENAVLNGIANATFFTVNLQEDIAYLLSKEKYHKVVLDPPRTGAKEVLNLPSVHNAQKIVYISCNPATFARDAGILVYHYQYKLRKIGIVDMFPHTSHTESIALFEK